MAEHDVPADSMLWPAGGTNSATRIGTTRSHLKAIGGGLAIEYVIGDQRIPVA